MRRENDDDRCVCVVREIKERGFICVFGCYRGSRYEYLYLHLRPWFFLQTRNVRARVQADFFPIKLRLFAL